MELRQTFTCGPYHTQHPYHSNLPTELLHIRLYTSCGGTHTPPPTHASDSNQTQQFVIFLIIPNRLLCIHDSLPEEVVVVYSKRSVWIRGDIDNNPKDGVQVPSQCGRPILHWTRRDIRPVCLMLRL